MNVSYILGIEEIVVTGPNPHPERPNIAFVGVGLLLKSMSL